MTFLDTYFYTDTERLLVLWCSFLLVAVKQTYPYKFSDYLVSMYQPSRFCLFLGLNYVVRYTYIWPVN
jgi:hypothetical protein